MRGNRERRPYPRAVAAATGSRAARSALWFVLFLAGTASTVWLVWLVVGGMRDGDWATVADLSIGFLLSVPAALVGALGLLRERRS